MKKLLQHAARLCGYRIISRDHLGVRYAEYSQSGGLFEDILLKCFGQPDGLRFLQVGANDGQRMDPIAHLIDAHRWSGVMLEPMPGPFAELKKFCGSNERLTLLNAAVDTQSGSRTLYTIAPDTPGAPPWSSALASFDRNRLAAASQSLNLASECVEAHTVPCLSWSEVWAYFSADACDVLVIDTEGLDITLLRGADLASHRPRLILFEHGCNTIDERMAFYRELIELGYELATLGTDTVAYRSAS